MEIQLIDMLGETFIVVFFLGASYIYSISPWEWSNTQLQYDVDVFIF